jgi:peptidoglycan/xylan/chitin deacetylase (PgdA/CDA1 family)
MKSIVKSLLINVLLLGLVSLNFAIAPNSAFAKNKDSKKHPKIALTFDDGPGPYTDQLLNILNKYNAHATFCVVGNKVDDYKATILKMQKNGNEIIGHSWSHANLAYMNYRTLSKHIRGTRTVIKQIIGPKNAPKMFRPPWGSFNRFVRATAKDWGYSILMWNVDPKDWKYRNSKYVYNHVVSHAKNGNIVLSHDIHRTTVEAYKRIIPKLTKMGFDLVTVDQLLGRPAAPGEVIYRK